MATATAPAERAVPGRADHPLLALTARRLAIGVLTLFLVSVIVFLATEVLPGNAAYAVLGHTATPARLHALEAQLHLNRGLFGQYWAWLSGLLTGNPGTSLANGQGVWGQVYPRLINSAGLVFISGAIGSLLVWHSVRRRRSGRQLDRPGSPRLRRSRNVVARVRRRDRPDLVLLATVVSTCFQRCRCSRQGRTRGAVGAGIAGRHARYRHRPVHLPDDARRDDRGAGVGLCRDGRLRGVAGAGRRNARTAERHPAGRSR